MGEKTAFDPNNYLDSPKDYEKMGGWKLTSEQVRQIADARLKRRAELESKEAKSRQADITSADSELMGLWIRTNTLPRGKTSPITWNTTIDIPSVSIADLPLPNILKEEK